MYNRGLGADLGLSGTVMDAPGNAMVFSGNRVPEGASPVAMAYSGHQFGHFNPQLGDGRALLLGQVINREGKQVDIHMKGTGQTRFSRNGDGRSALGPVLREYLVSEAMASLGVPTTRALAAVTTGETVARDRLLPGGVITRVASSFVRIGTFQYLLARRDRDGIERLADYVIEYLYPELKLTHNPYLGLLETVIERQAIVIARWMQIGFIHGVMNTDNMSISGETIDYGPCAFMDYFSHDQVYSSIDRQGRYAYGNQPGIGLWNLTRFAECLLHLFDENEAVAEQLATERLEAFVSSYQAHWLKGMCEKLGLREVRDEDRGLVEELLAIMEACSADFTLTFHHLSRIGGNDPGTARMHELFGDRESIDSWIARWRSRLGDESSTDLDRQQRMRRVNPVYIPRNHQIEAAIRAAEDDNDFSPFRSLHDVLQAPYEEQADRDAYLQPPRPHEIVHATFCGT